MAYEDLTPGDIISLTVPESSNNTRLDRFLAEALEAGVSRSQLARWLDGGSIRNAQRLEAKLKASMKVKTDEVYQIEVPPPVLPDLTPTDLKLEVIHEDDDLAVIRKPAGYAVHPGPADQDVTIVNGLLHLWKNLAAEDGYRPGIVHRLDKLTEGLLLVAKNDNTLRRLSEQFKNRSVEKEYLAWLVAVPKQSQGRIDLPLERHPHDRLKMRVAEAGSGRDALTFYEVVKTVLSRKGRTYAKVRVKIATGRTHQIRVHMGNMGAPVVGDPLYSRSAPSFKNYGLMLLAQKLEFQHPRTGETLSFELASPDRFNEFEEECSNL